MNIDIKEIGKGKTYFVIEEGQANLGNFEVALKMVDVAATTGADAIEFQLAKAGDFYIKSHNGYKIYKDREFSDSQLMELSSYTREKGLNLIVSPLTSKMIGQMAINGCSAFNINASDLTNPETLDIIATCGLPFFLSLLFAKEGEIEWAVNRIMQHGAPEFGLLLGQHTMASGEHGVDLKHTNLGYINTLKKKYNVPVGFIDHSANIWSPAIAVSAGADIITKHLAISRAIKGPDWHVCLEPNEMTEAIRIVKEVDQSLAAVNKTIAPGEDIDRSIMRRSIVAKRKIEKGQIIGKDDIAFKRPGTGISPADVENILGKKTLILIEEDQLISYTDIQ
ncbi:MAG: N-acetylneuraminate synthase family protein [bacterium]|nr:N-acetylneuraminate synthase family protein [bacterium]